MHTEYALLIWQPEVSAYSVCTLLWLYGGYVRKLVDYSYVAFIVNALHSTPLLLQWHVQLVQAFVSSTGRYELEVAASAALVHCSRAPAELSSSALVPPRCSLSLYYPVITLVHLPLELRSRAGAYSSNHRFLTRTSAHTYYSTLISYFKNYYSS